jgi:tRNA(Ile)-lysidine synthase
LEESIGPGITEALARSADLLRDDADALDGWATQVAAELDLANLEITRLADLPKAVRTRLLRKAIYAAGAPMGSITAEHVASVEAFVTSWHGQGACSLPGGVKVSRISGRLSLLSR